METINNINSILNDCIDKIIKTIEKKHFNEYGVSKFVIDKLKEINSSETDRNISSWYYFKLDGIEYILIGEDHKLKSSEVTFYDVLNDLINNASIDIDVFIEHLYTDRFKTNKINSNIKNEYDEEEDVLYNIQSLSEERNDNNKLIKIHCCDVRNNGIMNLICNSCNYAKNLDKINRKQFYDDLIKTISNNHNLLSTIINKQLKKIDRKYIKYFRKYFDMYKKFYNNKVLNYVLWVNEKDNDICVELLQNCDSFIVDRYTIPRMLKNYRSKLRIAYFGSAHMCRLYHLFFTQFEELELIDCYEKEGMAVPHAKYAKVFNTDQEIEITTENFLYY